MMAKDSRRQRLLEFAETGRLRNAVESRVDSDVADLIVDVCLRYCSSRVSAMRKRARLRLAARRG